MSPFVYYMWNRLFKYALALAFFYAAKTGCVYAFFGLYPNSKGLGITVCLFNALFFIYEIKCLFGQGRKTYFESYWNWMDIFVQSFSFCIAVVCMSVQNTDSKVMAWLRIFAISLIYLRAITWFRIFKPTRYLITMMIRVFREMVSFLASSWFASWDSRSSGASHLSFKILWLASSRLWCHRCTTPSTPWSC